MRLVIGEAGVEIVGDTEQEIMTTLARFAEFYTGQFTASADAQRQIASVQLERAYTEHERTHGIGNDEPFAPSRLPWSARPDVFIAAGVDAGLWQLHP